MTTDRLCTVMAGVGHYLPEHIISMEEIERRVKYRDHGSLRPGIITSLTGIKEKRYAPEGEYPSDLALKAARMALNRAAQKPADLDLIIFASCTQDLAEPATANILQKKLQASNAHVLDVKNACNSFLNALDIVDSLIKTGKCRTALVAAGEVFSPVINWEFTTREELKAGLAALTLGDGGGAVVLKASEERNRGFQQSVFESDGSQWQLATVIGGGIIAPWNPEAVYFISQSKALLFETISHIPTVVKRVLERSGWDLQDVDLVCCHQVSMQGLSLASQSVGFSLKKCMITVPHYGNIGAASIPVGLSEAYQNGLVSRGTKILLVGAASGISIGAVSLIW